MPIEGFSHHAWPLFDLMKKDVPWAWNDNQQKAFNELKNHITSSPVLQFTDNSLPFGVEADSSNFVTGAVLLQQSPEDDKWHPVSFYSKLLNNVEWNYEIHDKEMLAIITALKEWCHFLEGSQHKLEIWTDHKNLKYFMTVKKLNWWQIVSHRWKGRNIEFLVKWNLGDSTWEPVSNCNELEALDNYLTLSDVKRWQDLPKRVTMTSWRSGNQNVKNKGTRSNQNDDGMEWKKIN